ncbi:dienelactone hydrolase family protein [Polyangium jinanense]|uniref:Dienelactone hydrolase family protein n=1 Tax=Polyangium jinanense TaxID=2829994 RepID=A0A9X3X4J2_9BACT|nr:dienelactone hydrolase family protein [Polyangium jinanense]MDC3954934.1 dienelactone hydrolase family protein [Polyangium jinanense]MDC3981296.1 dienelactone hydrolase family protein [Polyangium jinanense]
MQKFGVVLGIAGLVFASACTGGGDTGLSGTITTGPTGSGSGASGPGGSGGVGGTGGDGDVGGAAGAGGSGQGGAGGGAPMDVFDPDKDGPFTIAEIDDNQWKASTGDTVPMHAAYPTAGPSSGPYPVVVVAHGFQIAASQYHGYLKRLASFGYVAVTPDYPTSLAGTDNTKATQNIISGLDWVESKPELKGDTKLAGATGHSLGGKLAVYAAKLDERFKATIVLDPVDGAPSNPLQPNPTCNAPACIDVSAELPIEKPTGFLGETLDSMTGGFQPACAPAAENFITFYAKAIAPSIAVTINGANHVGFVDNTQTCGFACSACKMPTLDNATVNALSRAYVTAFYERYLRGNIAYNAYLTGAEAQARYVDTGIASIQSKTFAP